MQALTGTITTTLTIKVPAGSSVGVEIEDRTVTEVTRPELGWREGDFILEINGKETTNQDRLVEAAQTARSKGEPIAIRVRRLSQSPFVKITANLENIYRDAPGSVSLPEPDEVSKSFRELKNRANLAQDGAIEVAALKERVQRLAGVLDDYASVDG